MREHLQFMAERGVLAMTPGQALDDVMSNLGIDQTRIESLRTMVERPTKLDNFSADAQFLACINTRYTVQEIYLKRYDA